MRRVTGVFVSVVLVVAAVAAGVFAAGGAARPNDSTATSKVTVAASEFKFVLSKRTVPAGTVTFVVANKGKLAHDFKIGGKKTPILKPGKSATISGKFKKGRYAYLCTVPGHAAAGMKGTFTVK
jgi:nitrite reductase (NO-forming)